MNNLVKSNKIIENLEGKQSKEELREGRLKGTKFECSFCQVFLEIRTLNVLPRFLDSSLRQSSQDTFERVLRSKLEYSHFTSAPRSSLLSRCWSLRCKNLIVCFDRET